MVKQAPNHMMENMIGYAHNPREIHQGGYIPIFPSGLINLTKYGLAILDPGFNQWPLLKPGSHYPTFERRLLQYAYVPLLSVRS